MNIICGLPRSGSTLLCNILNQNPRFHATSTSPLVTCFGALLGHLSRSIEIKGELGQDRQAVERKVKRSVKAFCDSWHRDQAGKEVFDKNRGWLHNIIPLLEIYPDAKIIVTVRDLRDVFASIEKQHRRSGLFREEMVPLKANLADRLERMFNADGLIGTPLLGIKDCLLRQLPVHFMRYEDWSADPKAAFNKLYCFLLEDEFEHDFENVINTSTDPDHMMLYKYPHEGSGQVKPAMGSWKDYMREEVGVQIITLFEWFCKEFDYS